MSTHPGTYLLRESDSKFLLYLGEYSSRQGLSLLPRKLEIEDLSLGTDDYKDLGWATESDFPTFKTSGELLDFMQANEVVFITFEVAFKNYGTLSTHDDGECHFQLMNRDDTLDLIKQSAPVQHAALILAKLIELPNKYLKVDSHGALHVYHTFDQYLKENHDL